MTQIPKHTLESLEIYYFYPGCTTANSGPPDGLVRDLDLNDLERARYFITPPESVDFDLADPACPYWTLTKQGWGPNDEARELRIGGLALVTAARIAGHIRQLTEEDAV